MNFTTPTPAPTPTPTPTANEDCSGKLNLSDMTHVDYDLQMVLKFCEEFYNAPAQKVIYAIQRNNGSTGNCYTMKHYTMDKFCRNMDHCTPFDKAACCKISREEFIEIWNSCIYCH